MSDKFKNKYRIESNRLRGWDYSSNGYYFITLVSQSRECLFGEIENGKMILSDFGKIANEEWHKSFEIRQELFLDEFILMPNHLHAIVVIDKKHTADDNRMNDDYIDDYILDDDCNIVHKQTGCVPSKFHRKPKSISSFVGGYKSAVINKIDDFLDYFVDTQGRAYLQNNRIFDKKFNKFNRLWQPNYHDHIIRNDESYHRIKNYIQTNPEKWNKDKFNPDNE